MSLVSNGDDVSSKRVAALFTLLNVLILAYMAASKKDNVLPEYMFNGLVLIIGGGLGLTVVEKIFTKKLDQPCQPTTPELPPAVDKPEASDKPDTPDNN